MSREAVAKVVKTDFTDAADMLVLDLSSAYKVPELKKLERTFVFSRRGAGKITVSDAVEFDSPQEFETALITFGEGKRLAPNRLQVGDDREHVIVEIATDGGEFRIVPEVIHEEAARRPGRHAAGRRACKTCHAGDNYADDHAVEAVAVLWRTDHAEQEGRLDGCGSGRNVTGGSLPRRAAGGGEACSRRRAGQGKPAPQ